MPLVTPSKAEEILNDQNAGPLAGPGGHRDNQIPDRHGAGFPGWQVHRYHEAGIRLPGN